MTAVASSVRPDVVRFGIVGAGNMGTFHAKALLDGKVPRGVLAAVCDPNPARLAEFADPVRGFADPGEMMRSGVIDAVIIATPHFQHVSVGIDAIAAGLHVLVEKPLAVHKTDCERLLAAYDTRTRRDLVFAAVFNQRTDGRYRALKQLIDQGELGAIQRITWIDTDWYRPECYYQSGGWRGTWKGEGGGVLVNQCPHHLDMLQWLFGMPAKVRAFCHFGRFHDIEVEDSVTAYLDYANGATGVFIATTGEAPGTNRLEIVGEHGRVVLEDEKIRWTRNAVGAREFSRTTTAPFSKPEFEIREVPSLGEGEQHVGIAKNFVAAVLDGTPLIAPAAEGIRSVELANAMIYSSLTDSTVALPLDGAAYARELGTLIADSRFEKKVVKSALGDVSGTFGR